MPENEALAKKIKSLRKVMHETQFEFAENCGISIETLSLIERQKTNPQLGTLQKISAYTNLTVAELLEITTAEGDE